MKTLTAPRQIAYQKEGEQVYRKKDKQRWVIE